MHAVDDAHGRHVIDARVEANLVEQNDACVSGRAVQRPHLVADVAGGDQRRPMADTFLSNVHVVDVGQQTDGQVALGDQIV